MALKGSFVIIPGSRLRSTGCVSVVADSLEQAGTVLSRWGQVTPESKERVRSWLESQAAPSANGWECISYQGGAYAELMYVPDKD